MSLENWASIEKATIPYTSNEKSDPAQKTYDNYFLMSDLSIFYCLAFFAGSSRDRTMNIVSIFLCFLPFLSIRQNCVQHHLSLR